MKATHLRWLVDDLERMRVFYRDALGFREATVTPTYVEYDTAGLRLGLFKRDQMEAVSGYRMNTSNSDSVLGVYCQDVDAEYRRLVTAGLEFLNPPHDQTVWRLRIAHLRDPAGHLVELYTPIVA